MRVPGKSVPSAGPSTSAPSITVPTMKPMEDQPMLPSLLAMGPSGSGKTNTIKQLCEAGLKVCFIPIEPKAFTVARNRPYVINICEPINGRLPTDIERYQRLRLFMKELRAGKHRVTEDGTHIDLLAFDGLTEVADLIYGNAKAKYTKKDSLDLWTAVGTETLQFFRDCRDIAGIASVSLGMPPLGVVATCLEVTAKKLDVKTGVSRIERDQPALQGQMALPRLASIFEVVLRLDAGPNPISGEHEFRVHTVLGETYFAKAPAGIFPPVVTGPGGPDNDPDVGKMYLEMLTNEKSPYFQAGRAA